MMTLGDVFAAATGYRRSQRAALSRTLLIVNHMRAFMGAEPIDPDEEPEPPPPSREAWLKMVAETEND